ncbi:MAG: HIT family protein [Candidatus Bathyarchaeota archaeon]|nr:HIT family protein [Candidatus Bathyarchaeota archaeon]MDH5732380.1 HIT family protein [Candidatus Bathyarchaeota archaeon]
MKSEVQILGECVFCHIVNGTASASILYSDEKVIAFLDIQPVTPGHVLIIPKAHAAQLSELDPETGAHMFKIAMHLAAGIRRSGVKCEGINLFLADGKVASQEIFHVHLHVIPRFKGDGFGWKVGPNYGSKPDREELDAVAGKIKVAMRPHE